MRDEPLTGELAGQPRQPSTESTFRPRRHRSAPLLACSQPARLRQRHAVAPFQELCRTGAHERYIDKSCLRHSCSQLFCGDFIFAAILLVFALDSGNVAELQTEKLAKETQNRVANLISDPFPEQL